MSENDIVSRNGSVFVRKSDLDYLNIVLDISGIMSVGNTTLEIISENIVALNGNTMMYPNAYILVNSRKYISVNLLAMAFSKMYEANDNEIRLWISDYENNLVTGVVSLPKEEKAPAGGVEVEIFLGSVVKQTNPIIGGGIVISADDSIEITPIEKVNMSSSAVNGLNFGINGEKKQTYENLKSENAPLKYDKMISKTVVIPEGEHSVYYYIKCDLPIQILQVGYIVNSNGYEDSGYVNYNKTNKYNFQINKKSVISGKIQLPAISEEDETVMVLLSSKNEKYIKEYTVLAGETEVSYQMSVLPMYYDLTVVSKSGNYIRENKRVGLYEDYQCNIPLAKSPEISVSLKLPDNKTATEDIYATVFLQSAKSPYYVTESKNVQIPSGSGGCSLTLKDELDSGEYICYYQLISGDYFDWGHYNSHKTVADAANAEITDGKNPIEIELIKNKYLNFEFKLPSEEKAKNNIRICSVANVAESPDYSFFNTAGKNPDCIDNLPDKEYHIGIDGNILCEPNEFFYFMQTILMKKGDRTGEYGVRIPDEDGYKYTICFGLDNFNDRYWNKFYYTDGGATVFADKAVIAKENAVNAVTLMKKYKVKGKIDSLDFEGKNKIRAIYQGDLSVKNKKSEYISELIKIGNGNYTLCLPEELKSYILELSNANKTVYYKNGQCSDDISDAEILNVTDDMEDIDFVYKFNSDLPILTSVTGFENSKCKFDAKNISDYEKENVVFYIAFYKENKLLEMKEEGPISFLPRSTVGFQIDIDDGLYQSADRVSVFLWDKAFKPMSLIHNIKDKVTIDDGVVLRGQLAQIFVNYYENKRGIIEFSGDNPYVDTKDAEVEKAYNIEVMVGYEDDTFRPYANVTNAEAAVMLTKLISALGKDVPELDELSVFRNIDKSDWCYNYVNSLKTMGIYDSVFEADFPADEWLTGNVLKLMISNLDKVIGQ